MAIVEEIVQPQNVPKLISWVEKLKDEHKKGLNVIKTVVDLKGTKRFKKPKGSEASYLSTDIDLTAGPNSNARAHFRKITTQTSYCKTFGERPKAQEDFNILKSKKFTDLSIIKILKPHVAQTLNRWLEINDQDKFTGRIYFTVREMYTVVKNQVAEVPTSHGSFLNEKQLAKAPRFDQILTQLKETQRK